MLADALATAPAGEGVVALCAATDGSDGTGGGAGGWAEAAVIARGAALGLDARAALRRADSGAFLAATGDAWSRRSDRHQRHGSRAGLAPVRRGCGNAGSGAARLFILAPAFAPESLCRCAS
jgi:hypothetical protein